MQNLPVIVAIFVAAAAIIAVLFWRIKPQVTADTSAADKRIAEELERARFIQAKLDAREAALSEALTSAASAKATTEAAHARASGAEARTARLEVDLSALQNKHNELQPSLTAALEKMKAAEEARDMAEQRFASLTVKHDALMVEHKSAIARAATAQNEATNTHTRNGEILRAYETMVQELDAAKRELVEAAAKQQSNEDSTRHFENISQTVLKEVLEEAKRGVGEIAATFQKSGGEELNKHAEKVAQTLEPLQAKLLAYDEAMKRMEQDAQKTYGGLTQQITELRNAEISLDKQAKALTTALSASPKVKGSYGELMLKQLVEFVGMHERCHFETQASRETEEGRKIPDMVVSLPGGQKVLVDSKAVMDACVEALQAEDDAQKTILLKKHCDNVRSRVADLASKNYFLDHRDAVEAVVLFLPAENLYATALENDPGLTEYAMTRNIIVCGPNSLMMLLKVANQLWQRASIEEEAQKIKECGDGIYKSACDFVEKFARIGTKIRQLEGDYNDAAGTLDSRLIPRGREMSRFASLANHREIEDIPLLKEDIREFRSAEAKKLLAVTTQLPGLVVGDETAELSFTVGGEL